ncbi:MAG: CGNR zinc finger domain-containing protein [Propionibacteriaceae bacterium]
MYFTHDTEVALVEAVALVNTAHDGVDDLTDQAGLEAFLREYPFTGALAHTAEELDEVRRLRDRIRPLWHVAGRAEAAELVNALLCDTDARPYVIAHDGYDWHLHVTGFGAPLAHRMGGEAAMGFLDLIRNDDLGRLKVCAAENCEAVLVDLSRNSSKRFCDTGNCANRAHVAAYRARQRARAAD